MTHSESLLWAIGEVNDQAILDARSPQPAGRRSLRRVVTIALAAALMLAMSITAVGYYTGADWFETYFNWGRPLTDEQGEYVTSAMVELDKTAEVGGWTVHLDKGMTDGVVALFNLTLTGPDGTALTDLEFFFDGFELRNPETTLSRLTGTKSFRRKDESTGEFSLRIDNDPEYRSFSLADGEECVLTLWDLRLYTQHAGEEPVDVIEGTWEFRFAFPETTGALELVDEPVTSKSGTVVFTDVRLSPLSLWVEYTADRQEAANGVADALIDPYGYHPDHRNPTVVMKDGTEYRAIGFGGGTTIGSTGLHSDLHYSFYTPLLLENADYLIFNDGTRIYIP